MPLIKSKSKAAFSHNVAAEERAGKPPKQAVAIAYRERAAAVQPPHSAKHRHAKPSGH